MGDELKPVPRWMEELSQSQMDAAFGLLARAEKAEAEVERLARERDEARAKERQRTLAYEVAIQTVLHFLRPTDAGMRQLERERIEHAGDLVGYLRRVLDERKEGK